MLDENPMTAERYLALGDSALVAQCSVDHYRSSGPGGQKRNKTSSAVRLRHHPTGLSVTAVEDRSQHVNQTKAVRRLREAIALNVRATVDIERYRSSAILASCLSSDGRLCVGRRDHRYFAAIGEVLDVLKGCDMRVSEAAKRIGVSTANLVKWIENDPKVWERVNQMRLAAGEKPLR